MSYLSEEKRPPVEFNKSLWQMFEDGYRINPEAPCLTACHQAADHLVKLLPPDSRDRQQSCLVWSYREIRHASLVLAKAMTDLGVKRGSTMMVPIPNGVETHLIRLVSWILQITIVVLDADLVEPPRHDELAFFTQTMSPALILVPSDKDTSAVTNAAGESGHKYDFIFRTQPSEELPSHSWAQIDAEKYSSESLEELARQEDEALEKDGNRVAVVLFTSGTTTGRPKGCPLSVRNIVSTCLNEMWVSDVPNSFAVHNPHSRALYNCFGIMGLPFGRHLIQSWSHFIPEKVFEGVKKHKAEGLMIVTGPVRVMAAAKHIDWPQLTSVRSVYLGGDVLDTELFAKVQAMFPQARIIPVWGMSEGTGMIGPRELDRAIPWRTWYDIISVGKIARSAHIRICDPQDPTKILRRGLEGELHVNGPAMITQYVDNVQPELFYTDSSGRWIRTGDKALMDEDGYVFMTGRLKDIIKQSGINISPFVLEATLDKADNISSAVFGVPHPIKGEEPVAVVTGKMSERRRSSIKQIISSSLGKDFALKQVYGLEELGMKDWPLSAQGKIQKFKLKEEMFKFEQEKSRLTFCHHGGMFYPWFV